MVLAGGQRKGRAELPHLDRALFELAHGVLVRKGGVVDAADIGKAAHGAVQDGLGVPGILELAKVAVEVTGVPGLFLSEDDLGDIELFTGGGKELIGRLCLRAKGNGGGQQGSSRKQTAGELGAAAWAVHAGEGPWGRAFLP